jgi:hypothetical protein
MVESQHSCYAIFRETLALAQQHPRTFDNQQRLDSLLVDYFQDNAVGARFRSMICYGRDDLLVSLEDVNNFIVLPQSQFAMELCLSTVSTVHVPIRFQSVSVDTKKQLHHDTLTRAHASVDFVLTYVTEHCFENNDDVAFYASKSPPLVWKNCILGKDDRSELKIVDVPSLEDLQDRIRKSIEFSCAQKEKNPKAKFFTRLSALAWQSTAQKIDPKPIYLEACSHFKDHLEQILKEKGTTLDVLAGVVPPRRYPRVEAVVREGFKRSRLKGMHSKDLLLEDKTLGGTVIVMHNEGFLSPEWIAAYLVDTDNNHFMQDVRAEKANNKDRLLRIFSANHDFEFPTWIQFGATKNVYLYLSQQASAAEHGWLTIVSYVTNLLIDFVNKKLDQATANRYRLEQVVFDTGVASLANPSVGSFSKHQDGFDGLIHATTKGYSRFLLMVPTFAIQNHCAPTSHISWYQNGGTNSVVASFAHDFLIQHWQLIGVNHNFVHDVSSSAWLRAAPASPSFPHHFLLYLVLLVGHVLLQRFCGSERFSLISDCAFYFRTNGGYPGTPQPQHHHGHRQQFRLSA